MIAIHFEAEKDYFPNLLFGKITIKTWFFTNHVQKIQGVTTSGGFIEVNNCLI